MKNLTIFVLTLVAISSVCSLKLNKVLKEEKVLSVTQNSAENKVEEKSGDIYRRGDRDDDRGRKTETSVNTESAAENTKRTKVEAQSLISEQANQIPLCERDPKVLFNIVDDGSINCRTKCDDDVGNIIYDFASLLGKSDSDLNVFSLEGKKCR